MACRVRWDDELSSEFPVPLGTKQGGVSSPGYFCLYVDGMIDLLQKNGIGCHITNTFLGAILFADDLVLIAPTRAALQRLIDTCGKYCTDYCLQLNPKKSKVMFFGKKYGMPPACVEIMGSPIDFVDEWKYLGTTIKSGCAFSFSARPDISGFFRAANSVIHVLSGAHEHTLLTLVYTNCVPILTYACNVKEYSAADMADCNLAMNNVLRRIFGFSQWQSIRTLREIFGFKSLYETFKLAKDRFQTACLHHTNPIIVKLSLLLSQ